jgi:hypothetical protein
MTLEEDIVDAIAHGPIETVRQLHRLIIDHGGTVVRDLVEAHQESFDRGWWWTRYTSRDGTNVYAVWPKAEMANAARRELHSR